MHFAAVHAEGSVVIAHGLLTWRVQEAVHLPVGVMEQLHLPDAELIGLAGMRTCRDAVNGVLRQFQVGRKSMNCGIASSSNLPINVRRILRRSRQ